MKENKKQHNWKTAQPHLATTGRIVTRKFADKNPNKVEWVRSK
jgi:hypothetical protein